MGIISTVKAMFAPRRPSSVSEWFIVTFDADVVHLQASPPGRPAWAQKFAWSSVTRVCFKAEDVLTSDGIYVFTTNRPESYVIPTEARGGGEFWSEVLRRNLFDPKLAIEAALSNGGLYCWPPDAPVGDGRPSRRESV